MEHQLYSDERWAKLKHKGWNTMTLYAFAWGQLEPGKTPSEPEFLDVVKKIEGFDWHDPQTYPRAWHPTSGYGPATIPQEPPWHLYRKTMFESRFATSIEMNRKWKAGEEVVRKLTSIERQEKRHDLQKKYGTTSGCMEGEREPSEALEDTLHNWKELNRITHPLSLADCTSIEQEWNQRRLQPAKKPRVAVLDQDSESTVLTLASKPETNATSEVHSVHQLTNALFRLGYALELTDLVEFEVFYTWIKKLLSKMNKDDMLSSTVLSVQDAMHAHDILFKIMEIETRHKGIRHDLTTGRAPLEDALKLAMNSVKIERALEPREETRRPVQRESKGAGRGKGAAREGEEKSKSQKKREAVVGKATKDMQSQIEELKRKLSKGGKAGKGKGDGKKAKGEGKKGAKLPEAMRGGKHQATSGDGRRICFGYNLGTCTEVEPGKECKKGWHICSIKGCKDKHSAKECDKAT